jgi:hypothetical protein
MVMGGTPGVMAENTSENGKTIKWMAGGNSNGLMEGGMWGIILRIKNMGKESSIGRMAGFIKADGTKGNNMDMECMLVLVAKKNKVNGSMGKESDG